MKSISDIIFAVRNCRMDAIGLQKICAECPYHYKINCIHDLKEDIIAALSMITKPRVLLPNEIAALPQGAIVYAELCITDELIPMRRLGNDFISIGNIDDHFLLNEITESLDYNVYYRFWSGEPSQEYRNFIPWREKYNDIE